MSSSEEEEVLVCVTCGNEFSALRYYRSHLKYPINKKCQLAQQRMFTPPRKQRRGDRSIHHARHEADNASPVIEATNAEDDDQMPFLDSNYDSSDEEGDDDDVILGSDCPRKDRMDFSNEFDEAVGDDDDVNPGSHPAQFTYGLDSGAKRDFPVSFGSFGDQVDLSGSFGFFFLKGQQRS